MWGLWDWEISKLRLIRIVGKHNWTGLTVGQMPIASMNARTSWRGLSLFSKSSKISISFFLHFHLFWSKQYVINSLSPFHWIVKTIHWYTWYFLTIDIWMSLYQSRVWISAEITELNHTQEIMKYVNHEIYLICAYQRKYN